MSVGGYTLGLITSEGWLFLPVGLLLVILAYRAYRPSRSGPSLHVLLFLLRSFVLLLAALLLIAPRLTVTANRSRPPLVALLIDDSESMRILAGDVPRYHLVSDILEAGTFDHLGGAARFRVFRFSEGLADADLSEHYRWRGQATDLATSLAQVSTRLQGEGLSGLFLLSDGAHNVGPSPLQTAQAFPSPIYSVAIGKDHPPKDVSVNSVTHPTLGYLGQKVKVRAKLGVIGMQRVDHSINVTDGGQVLASQPIIVDAGEQEVTVTFTPDASGDRTYTVVVPPLKGEVEPQNNQMLTRIEILVAKRRVLLVGTPSADFAYLRRIVAADSNVTVETIYPDSPLGWAYKVRSRLADATGYDLVILHDVPDAILTAETSAQIKSNVRDGSALLVVGGEEGFGPGWGSDLTDILPLLPAGPYEGGLLSGTIARESSSHSILMLEGKRLELKPEWDRLPPFTGANSTRIARSSGVRLLLESEKGAPLAAVRNAGRGKTMVVVGRGYSRQGLMMWGIGETDAVTRSFWTRALRWLLTQETVEKLRVTTDKETYRSGEPISVRAELYDDLLSPIDGAEVLLDVDGSPGRTAILPGRGSGIYEGRLQGLRQGQHGYRVTARYPEGKPVAVEGDLTVGRYSVEFEQLLTNVALLEEVAERSGGRLLESDSLSAFVRSMKLSPQPHVSIHEIDLWDDRYSLVVLVVGLAGEWFVRRRRGMI